MRVSKLCLAAGLAGCALLSAAAYGAQGKIDVLAVYYPHWHEYPKGNEWFHKGFNEWEFCRNAKPRVPGQKVPLRPLYGFIDGKNPDDVAKENISAKVSDGILTVTLPKIEETKVKVARSIEIG